MGDLAKHRSINITIKPDDKGFQIVVLDSNDYLAGEYEKLNGN